MSSISFAFDEALFLAVVFISALSSPSVFQMCKKPLRERKLQPNENVEERPLLSGRETWETEKQEQGENLVKVPLGIRHVPDIRCVFLKGTQGACLKMPRFYIDHSASLTVSRERVRGRLGSFGRENWLHE